MRLETEVRIQGIMIVATGIGAIGILALIVIGLILSSMSYLYGAIGLAVIVYLILTIGSRWTQKTMARCEKIREGSGGKADLEWLKTRKKQ